MTPPLTYTPPPDTEPIIMWQFGEPGSTPIYYGALEDGCIFQGSGGNWTTIHGTPDSNIHHLLTAANHWESRGWTLTVPPVRFGIDRRVADRIRADEWTNTSTGLLVAFLTVAGPRR